MAHLMLIVCWAMLGPYSTLFKMLKARRSSVFFVGIIGGAAVCWGMLSKVTSRSKGGNTKLPMEVRREKLDEAVQRFANMFAQVPAISASDAHSRLQEHPSKYVIVDVRNKEEQQVSMLPGARVLTAAKYEQQKDAYTDATVICYCTVGYRSSQYASSLLGKGQQALNLSGGIVGWTHAGLPLVKGSNRQQPTAKVHTYSEKWAYQADGYEPVHYTNSKFVMLRDVISTLKSALIGG